MFRSLSRLKLRINDGEEMILGTDKVQSLTYLGSIISIN